MRNALVFASLGLALGLAAHWAVAPKRDGVQPAPVARVAPADLPHPGHMPAHDHVHVDESAGAAPLADGEAGDAATSAAGTFEESAALEPPIPPSEAESARPALESRQQRIERLVAAGFAEERATAIVQAESQQRLSVASAEYAASGTIRALSASTTAADSLRETLGDADYERYLAATGRPTRVVVGEVALSSAAASAGLQTGDVIRTYGGRRVFGIRELNALMLEGAAGQTVPAEIVRDGQVLKLFVSSGPLGMAARSAR